MIHDTKKVFFPLNIETKDDIEKMKSIVSRNPNLMSLAANELGIYKQIIVYRKFQNEKQIYTLINPIIDIFSNEKESKLEEIHISGFDESIVLHENLLSGCIAKNLKQCICVLYSKTT